MLGLFLTLITQKILYQTDYRPQFKEIVPKVLELPKPVELEKIEEPEQVYHCSCVRYIREFVDAPLQDAIDYKPNSTASVGVVAIFKYNKIGHVALITEITGEYFMVKEANYIKCTAGVRKVKWDDPALIGFYKKEIIN